MVPREIRGRCLGSFGHETTPGVLLSNPMNDATEAKWAEREARWAAQEAQMNAQAAKTRAKHVATVYEALVAAEHNANANHALLTWQDMAAVAVDALEASGVVFATMGSWDEPND